MMKLSEDKKTVEISIEVEALLDIIPDRDIVNYAKDNYDLIHVDDADDYCDCEEINIYDYNDYEMIEEMQRRGYTVYDINPKGQSIVREMAINKILETVNSMSDSELNAIANRLV